MLPPSLIRKVSIVATHVYCCVHRFVCMKVTCLSTIIIIHCIYLSHKAEATKKATDLFQQKQFEQHHHHVHVPRSPFEESTYLDSLAKFGTGDDYDGSLHEEPIKGYLDTLSEVGKKKSTWDVYKDQVEKAEKEMKNHDEVDCKNTCLFVYTLHACWLACVFYSLFILLTIL